MDYYLQFHVMTNVEDLLIVFKKAMKKATEEVIRETHRKEREENKVRKVATYFIANDWAS